jgi:hypothetical protein
MDPFSIYTAVKELLPSVLKSVDDLVTSDEERGILKNKLAEIKSVVKIKSIEFNAKRLELETVALEAQKTIITAEAQGESWLQRSWRPVLMLTITFIIFNNYVLYPYLVLFFENAPVLELPDALFTLLSIGVGGYVVGRSGEKISKNMSAKS